MILALTSVQAGPLGSWQFSLRGQHDALLYPDLSGEETGGVVRLKERPDSIGDVLHGELEYDFRKLELLLEDGVRPSVGPNHPLQPIAPITPIVPVVPVMPVSPIPPTSSEEGHVPSNRQSGQSSHSSSGISRAIAPRTFIPVSAVCDSGSIGSTKLTGRAANRANPEGRGRRSVP